MSGIIIGSISRLYPYFAVWDMEALLLKSNEKVTDNLEWVSRHIPISVSIASNVPGFEKSVCFVEIDFKCLITSMMSYLVKISEVVRDILMADWKYVYDEIHEAVESYKSDRMISSDLKTHFINTLSNLKAMVDQYISQLPVIGFNSGKYDINLVRHELILALSKTGIETDLHCIKRNNSYLSLSNKFLKFLDISNYLAPGCSYSQFLKSYGSSIQKGYFPYEWFDSYDKLNYPTLPYKHDFYSTLTKSNPVESDIVYNELLEIWDKNDMKSFKDYLIYYNNLDTGPFCIALKTLMEFYFDQNIDLFKDFCTLPGIARQLLFKSIEVSFSLFAKSNSDMYYTFKKNIVGGPSIIFTRYHEKNVTLIKGIPGNVCQTVIGYDCNGLYSFGISQPMPTGNFVRRFESNNFRPEISQKYLSSFVWMDFIMENSNITILHRMNNNNKEIRIGSYLVDGFCSSNQTVYEFNGCMFHKCPHDCFISKKFRNTDWYIQRMKSLGNKDQVKYQYIQDKGYSIVDIYECVFILTIKSQCEKLYSKYLPSYYQTHKGSISVAKILSDVIKGDLFGCLEVDIEVDPEFKSRYEDYPPFLSHVIYLKI